MGDADFWDLNPVILKGDAGAVLARRRLAKLRETEADAARAGSPPVPAETRATS